MGKYCNKNHDNFFFSPKRLCGLSVGIFFPKTLMILAFEANNETSINWTFFRNSSHCVLQELISSEAGPCDIVYSRLSEEIGQTFSVDFPGLGNKKKVAQDPSPKDSKQKNICAASGLQITQRSPPEYSTLKSGKKCNLEICPK